MKKEANCIKIDEAIENIGFSGCYISHKLYESGHINDTFVVVFKQKDDSYKRYILQRINHEVFKNPEQVMMNITGVTNYLKEKILKNHGDIDRETINIILTKDGNSYYVDSIGSYWRGYLFIEGATSFDKVEKAEDFYESAITFGHFQHMLSNYPANKLHETIPNFHNTPIRFENFKNAVDNDILGRVKDVRDEIQFVLAREEFTHTLMDLYRTGQLPLRVTHNDTKLSNIMIDNKSGKGICVVDLDTVMPGFSVNDFGDAIRYGASTGAEDESDLSKVNFDITLFELFTKGFIKGCNGSLTDMELDMLPVGAKMMTLECGMRFLTDYLEGDTYFKIHHESHNLDRCRTQFKLVADMENQWEQMNQIVAKYR
jgi:hypothetical protein